MKHESTNEETTKHESWRNHKSQSTKKPLSTNHEETAIKHEAQRTTKHKETQSTKHEDTTTKHEVRRNCDIDTTTYIW